jgi:NTP pyrophosphatase (non-canonical NTP hydrolase)
MEARQERADNTATMADLKQDVESFVSERDWAQFHSPKNLAMVIGAEAGELMNIFRWRTEADSIKAVERGALREAVLDELADVVICALSFANRAKIDIADAVTKKLLKNAQKYPASEYRGKF